MARNAEWQQQVLLAELLTKWMPDDAFWSAVDTVAASALSGWVRRLRGVRPGLPDNLTLYRGKLIAIELKSPGGRCSASQPEAREALLRAGAEWWEARSANAAMWALAESGVRFRAIANADGTTERWRRPRLKPWEVPRRDPAEPRPNAPDVAAQRRAKRGWRERQRARGRDAGGAPAMANHDPLCNPVADCRVVGQGGYHNAYIGCVCCCRSGCPIDRARRIAMTILRPHAPSNER